MLGIDRGPGWPPTGETTTEVHFTDPYPPTQAKKHTISGEPRLALNSLARERKVIENGPK